MIRDFFVHEKGLCESEKVGAQTRIWAFAHVLPGATLGKNCNICDGVFVENDVIIGNNVTVKCGVQIWDGARIGNDVFIGPNATFSNDRFPRSQQYPDKFLSIEVGDNASIGANATLLAGIRIGKYAMIGAGAVVTTDVPPGAIMVGNPARVVGFCDTATGQRIEIRPSSSKIGGHGAKKDNPLVSDLGVGGAQLWQLISHRDSRGALMPLDFATALPFVPLRHFVVYDVPVSKVRGEHAHIATHQFLIALHGRVHALVKDGTNTDEVVLDNPAVGLYMPPRLWGTQYKFSRDCVLSVYASEPYDAADYIRDYAAYEIFVRDNG